MVELLLDISFLKKLINDHGEVLGEHNLYLMLLVVPSLPVCTIQDQPRPSQAVPSYSLDTNHKEGSAYAT